MSSDFSFDIAELGLTVDPLTGATVSVGEVVDTEVDSSDGVSVDFGDGITDVALDTSEGLSVGTGDLVGVETDFDGVPEITFLGTDVIDTFGDLVSIADIF